MRCRRMEELRASEVAETLEDLMYVSILEKFLTLRVEMLPRMDGEQRSEEKLNKLINPTVVLGTDTCF